jgi:hypothetical protein
MSRFSPSDAALEGFRLTRENPTSIAVWCLVYFGGIVLIGVAMLASLGPQFIALIRKGQLMTADPETVGNALSSSLPAFLAVLFLTLLLISVITGGIFRLVLRPGERGMAHLRLGADELRLAIVNFLFVLLGMLFLAGTAVVTGILSRIGGVFAGLAIVAFFAFLIWLGVRLTLVTPMTFDQRSIQVRAGWRETRDHFWPLVGMILLVGLFLMILLLLFSVIGLVLVELSRGPQGLNDMLHVTPLTVAATLLSLALQILYQVLQIIMVYAPFAVAYQALTTEKHRRFPVPSEPNDNGLHGFFATYDEAFDSWAGTISRSFHWSALAYWFLAFLALVLFQAGFALAGLVGQPNMADVGVAGAFILATPFNLMLLLSSVKRGRGAGVPGWVTAVLSPILPAVALVYAFLPEKAGA